MAGVWAFLAALSGSTPQLGAQVVINEILALNYRSITDEDDDLSDWIELLNTGSAAVDLAGYSLTDDEHQPRKWIFPTRVLRPGDRTLVWCSGKDRVHLDPDRVRDKKLKFSPTLISLASPWHVLAGLPNETGPPVGWETPDFDDTSWTSGPAGIGYGIEGVQTEVPEGSTAAFLRTSFRLDSEFTLPNLVFQTRFDDGFALFLNGERVLSVNVRDGDELTFASRSLRSSNPHLTIRYDLTESMNLLRPGENVVAIALLNLRETSIDMAIFPELGSVEQALHTNFGLSRDGDEVYLVDPMGRLQDGVEFPAQTRDQTYARSPDGFGSFFFHLNPTPLMPNVGPIAEMALTTRSPTASETRGFYTEPLLVELSTDEQGGEIRYTLDGRDPTTAESLIYSVPILIDRTTVLRAATLRVGSAPSLPITQTYLFVADIAGQPAMDPRITEIERYQDEIAPALTALPTVSIATSQEIAADREVDASIELLDPNGELEFHIDAGVRYVGGHSIGFPKKSMRLFFRGRYGTSTLDYPIFADTKYGEGAATSFDQLQLRSGSHDSVFYLGSAQQSPADAQYLRNRWMSDMQFEMGHLSIHGRFVHVYLNGTYWGQYHLMERPTASFMASYAGGNKEDYEAVNSGRGLGESAPIWESVRTLRENYAELSRRIDFENFADYILLNFYAGNDWDWNPNQNWMAAGPTRVDRGGYKFFAWDSDIIFRRTRDHNLNRGGPENLLRSLFENEEFRVLFMDQAHALFFNDGVLTPQRVEDSYLDRAKEIRMSIVAETARWQNGMLWTRDINWLRELERLRTEFFPQRTAIVVDQLQRAGWYSAVEAPVFVPQHGGVIDAGFVVSLTSIGGEIYYTLDGTDPRLTDGSISPQARLYRVPRSVVVDSRSPARILVPTDESLGLTWTQPDFVDSHWLAGSAAVGYELDSTYDEFIETDLEAQMKDRSTSAYIRIPFTVDDVENVVRLTLALRLDDAFVAYLNGVRVASRNAPEDPRWDSQARFTPPDQTASILQRMELEDAVPALLRGRNVLAIHGINRRTNDRDFLIVPQLAREDSSGDAFALDVTTRVRARTILDGEWSALTDATFAIPSPLRVTEIMFNPAPPTLIAGALDAQQFEFVELQNVSETPFDLAGMYVGGGIEFSFADAPVHELLPGEFVLLVKNFDAFSQRYDTRGMTIAGEYAGKLNNDGESFSLVGPGDAVFANVSFDESWFSETAGEGYSLVLREDVRPPIAFGKQSSWRPSDLIHGSPGQNDRAPPPFGWQIPGDLDQSGRLNVSDAIALLRVFTQPFPTLPCGDDLDTIGHRQLLDLNSDQTLDLADGVFMLSYLFQRGPEPRLGTSCQPLAGCPNLCAGG